MTTTRSRQRTPPPSRQSPAVAGIALLEEAEAKVSSQAQSGKHDGALL
jgi:hypothetical protein